MLFDKCIYVRFTKFLSKLTILSDTQYEFRKGCAAQEAIINLTEFVYATINNREFSSAFFIGHSKAFDPMNHRILDRYGIRGVANELKADCLYDHYRCVKINFEFSTALQINISVPQGSILGPFLFILYVNDLFRVLPSFLTIMYADVTTLLSSDNDFKNIVNVGSTELKLFYDLALAYRLSINVGKTF